MEQSATNNGPHTPLSKDTDQQQLTDTQNALQDALNQLQELSAANESVDVLRVQLESQSSALQDLGQTFAAAESQRAQELKDSLHRLLFFLHHLTLHLLIVIYLA